MGALTNVIYEHLLSKNAEEHRSKPGEFHPSELVGCTRALYYSFTGTEAKQITTPHGRLRMLHGSYLHSMIQKLLQEFYGDRFKQEVPVKTAHPILGHADGVLTLKSGKGVVVEIKSANDSSYAKTINGPLEGHAEQGHIYAGCLGIDKLHVIYYNKNDKVPKVDDPPIPLREFVLPYDPRVMVMAEAKIRLIQDCASSSTPPPQEVSYKCNDCRFLWTCQPKIV